MNYKLKKFSEESFGSIFFSKLFKLNLLIIIKCNFTRTCWSCFFIFCSRWDWDPWAKNHLIRLIFGIFLMLSLAFLPHKIFFKLSVLSFIIGILSLILVKFIGTGNVQRWITFGGMNFQPSEAMKIALILILARYFDHVSRIELDKLKKLYSSSFSYFFTWIFSNFSTRFRNRFDNNFIRVSNFILCRNFNEICYFVLYSFGLLSSIYLESTL